jgi:hypothetical protein
MANVLFGATANPATIKSGQQTTITVRCQVTSLGNMTVGSSNGYAITTTQRALSVGQPSDTFVETISGPQGNCFLTFVFDGSGTQTVVTIT